MNNDSLPSSTYFIVCKRRIITSATLMSSQLVLSEGFLCPDIMVKTVSP